MGQFQRREPWAGQLGSAMLKPQDAEQDLQSGPPPDSRTGAAPMGTVLAPLRAGFAQETLESGVCCQPPSHPFSHLTLGVSQTKAASTAHS